MISVLYVDDEKTLLEVTRVYLERTGDFAVTTCLSAHEALELLRTRAFDAIVSDYQMPGMDGLLFLKFLRDSGDAVPFILFTGKGREQVAIEALNTGADFYLQKGGEPKSQFAELMSKIRQVVQRRQAELALAASEEKYRDLVENINDIIFSVDNNGIVTYISSRIGEFGYTADQVIGKPFSGFIIPEDLTRFEGHLDEIQNGILRPFEFRIRTADRDPVFVRSSSRPVFEGERFLGVRGLLSDITAEKAAEAKATESEKRYRNVFEASGEALLMLDHGTGSILDANPAAHELFARSSLKGTNHADLREDTPPPGEEELTEVSGTPLSYYRKGDGTIFPAAVLESTYPRKRSTIRILSIRDLTGQKRAEERMLAARRLYEVLSQINQAIVRMKDLETLVAEICRISVDFGHFRMSWIGLLDRQTRTFRPVAHAGHEDGYLKAIEISVAGDARSKGPTGVALREGRSDICNDIGTDPRMEPWRGEALKRGYRSSAAIPFRLHGVVVGAYMIYASRNDFFNAAEIALLEEIAMDISFALDMLDEQARRTRAEQALAGSEERAGFLAMVLELSSQPFGVGYPDGSIGIVNPAFCDLVGYTEAELRQMSWKALTPPEHYEHESAILTMIAATGTPQRYEKEFFRKDGTRVPVELFVHRFVDKGGNLQYYTSFVTDITERRKIEEAVRAERDKAQQYLDTAGVMLAVLDTEGTISLINRRGCEILGYSEGELLGRSWIAACLPDSVRKEVQGVFDQIVQGDIAPVEYHENPVRRRDGQERVLAFHNTLLRNRDGGIAGILFSGEDITERIAAEKALFESEERFRNLIQNSGDMIRIIGTDGRIAYSSPSTRPITGFDPEELVGKDPLSFIHPDDRARVQEALDEVYARANTGTPTEYRIRHADGSWIDVEAVATNLIGMPGINGIVTTARVITERKKAEQALLESEWRYRAIFEKSTDAIIVMADTILDSNPAAEHLFGSSRVDLIGLSPADLSPPTQPDGRASADLAREHIQSVLGGTPRTFDWVHTTKDGRPFPASITLIPARVPGQERIIAIVHDRSAQVRDEQRFRHLARFPEMNPDPVIEVCRDREIRYANPAAKAILRRLGMPEDPGAFLPEDFDAIVITFLAESVPSLYREVRIGTAIFGETLSYDPEESTIRISARDITTRTFEREALEQTNHKLNLLSHITRHDVKNKLTGVMGYLELARGSARDPELIEYLSRAEISANAIRQQVEFTKEYENLGVRAPGWYCVSTLLTRAVSLLDHGSVSIQDETGGIVVYADPMVEKVLYCLLENALFHGKKLTRIRIFTLPSETGSTLVVEDDGVGVPSGLKEKIFSKKVGKEGGVGLFLSREILGITGITVAENGIPGNGARFELAIPSGKFQIKSRE